MLGLLLLLMSLLRALLLLLEVDFGSVLSDEPPLMLDLLLPRLSLLLLLLVLAVLRLLLPLLLHSFPLGLFFG